MDAIRPATATDRRFAARARLGEAHRPAALVVLLVLAAAGCGEQIDVIYGRQRGPGASASVNGTAVSAEMFEQSGHRVSTWWALSPRLESADCIVWFPDDFAPPPKPVRDWLERWLTARPNRTLVYVGRDFDAAVWYWDHVLPQVAPSQRKEVRRRGRMARARFTSERRTIPASQDCGWFVVKGKYQARKVRTLQGEPRWVKGIDPAKVEIELCGRIDRPQKMGQAALAPDQIEVLLSSGGDLLVMRQPWFVYEIEGTYWEESSFWQEPSGSWDEPIDRRWDDTRAEGPRTGPLRVQETDSGDWFAHLRQRDPVGQSQLIVVANGSFLLNLMLVNHEHRKLAGRLIAEVERCGGAPQEVVFLESGAGGPPIREHDPAQRGPSGLEALLAWPTWWMFVHLAFAGILLMFSRWPIFGIPRELPPENPPDFGRHIEALGELLRSTGNRAYAISRVIHYRQTVRGETRPARGSRPARAKQTSDASGDTAGGS